MDIQKHKKLVKLSGDALLEFLWTNVVKDDKTKKRVMMLLKEFLYSSIDEFVYRHPYNNKYNCSKNVSLRSWI